MEGTLEIGIEMIGIARLLPDLPLPLPLPFLLPLPLPSPPHSPLSPTPCLI